MKGKLRLTALLAAIAMFTSTMTPVYADQLGTDLLYVRSYVPRIAYLCPLKQSSGNSRLCRPDFADSLSRFD